jgi:hypothetical protein
MATHQSGTKWRHHPPSPTVAPKTFPFAFPHECGRKWLTLNIFVRRSARIIGGLSISRRVNNRRPSFMDCMMKMFIGRCRFRLPVQMPSKSISPDFNSIF